MPALPNAHAFVIGIANYANVSKLPLTVVKDASDIYNALVDPQVCAYPAYPPENVRLLVDEQATQSNLRAALDALAARATADSTILIYLSSHGGRIGSGADAREYLLPVDADASSEEKFAASAIGGDEFTEILRRIAARKVVVIFDCCHSGGIGQRKDAAAPAIKAGFSDQYYDTLKGGRGRVILASSRDSEYSYVLPGAENNLFTQHLLAGLRGGVPGPGGVIRIFDLFHYLGPKVTADQPNQHPIFKAELEENFPVALYLDASVPLQ